MWGIIYPVTNILLIVMHYHLSPPMYAWLSVAPLNSNPIDNPTPWSKPVDTYIPKNAGAAETKIVEVEEKADEVAPAADSQDGWL